MDREAIRTRLIEIRKKSGLSMDRLAAKLGISKNSVFLIESGKNFPTPETLDAWLSIGHTHMHYLIRDERIPTDALAALDEATAPLDREELALVLRLARALPRNRPHSHLTPLLEQVLRLLEAPNEDATN